VQIAAVSGIADTQPFAPAIDSAATSAAIPGLCGPRVYSIIEDPAHLLTTLDVFAGTDQFVDNWSLTFISNSLLDMGTWTVTLQVALADYASVPVATQTITVTVVHMCQSTVI